MKATILNVAVNNSLRKSRELILTNAGYVVISASNWEEFEQARSGNTIDLVLLGQTLPPSLKHDMADYTAKHYPKAKVAELYLYAASIPSKYSYHVAVSDVDGFLKFIEATLAEEH